MQPRHLFGYLDPQIEMPAWWSYGCLQITSIQASEPALMMLVTMFSPSFPLQLHLIAIMCKTVITISLGVPRERGFIYL